MALALLTPVLVLNFNAVNAHQPGEIQSSEHPGSTSALRHRSSVIPESGHLESPNDERMARSGEDSIFCAEVTRLDPSAPVYLTLPSFIRHESNLSSNSFADSFATAQSTTTVKAPAKIPELPRQNTDATTMSYATASGEPF